MQCDSSTTPLSSVIVHFANINKYSNKYSPINRKDQIIIIGADSIVPVRISHRDIDSIVPVRISHRDIDSIVPVRISN
jgi:hypothetical protein